MSVYLLQKKKKKITKNKKINRTVQYDQIHLPGKRIQGGENKTGVFSLFFERESKGISGGDISFH
jgi:hypothetical protein